MLERDLLPQYGAQGLRVVAVYGGEQTGFGQLVARDAALTFPIVFDLEWQVFERYRTPGAVFPLSVVVDRQGIVVHKDNDEDLASVEAAIVSALE